ncbi:hypothetical protein H0H87_010917 [Tephrocybe sp. NHM501043]|nr:hypothetical protein H0H87_010917 [Tephrocybe sp. NHM501043]
MFNSKITTNPQSTNREEEEEEEEDGDDEGVVEEQLNRPESDNHSNPSSPRSKTTGTADARTGKQPQQEDANSPERKRRPGRPRGSKNRKPRVGQTTTKQEPVFYTAPVTTVAPPQHPDVNAHNHQYYEFQWRVLNLCSEFYTAAEELVKATQPLVIAQCYQMGPGSKVDPLIMLNEAKRICDNLLSNPSQLVTSPPPPIYPQAPTFYSTVQTQPLASTSTSSSAGARPAASTSKSSTPSAVISNPSTFVMPLPAAQANAYSPYHMYTPQGQYPTTPYYQYPYVNTAAYFPPPHPQVSPPAQAQPQSQPAVAQPQPTPILQETSTATDSIGGATNVITTDSSGGNQGAWTPAELERLKKLAEESKAGSQTGEIDWDWVVGQWGNGRTRATNLGLKESSSRGVKRRRETEGTSETTSPSVPPTPTVAHVTTTATTATNPSTASPSHSQTGSTPAASPALQNQQRPQPKPSSGLPWPMPTVAVNTPSVVATSTSGAQDQQRTSYYRARPNQDTGKSSTTTTAHTHPYMYQPNGSAASSRIAKENGT